MFKYEGEKMLINLLRKQLIDRNYLLALDLIQSRTSSLK